MVRILVTLLAAATCVSAQLDAGLTAANECRHVAILARAQRNASYSARCFIPARILEDRRALRHIVPREWRWVYEHNGTVSGQVITYGSGTVTIISQKSCVDRGKTVGQPLRELYGKVGGNAEPIQEVGDFKTHTVPDDAYSDCVFNPTQWHQFGTLNGTALPLGTKQYVRRQIGGHLGIGQHMIPYNFTYDEQAMNKAVLRALRGEKQSQSSPSGADKCDKLGIQSECPIVLAEYPHESGLSILSTNPVNERGLTTSMYNDLSALSWNRALQAKAALASRIDPPLPEPDKLSSADLLSITVLTVVSTALYWTALKEARRSRRAAINGWSEPPIRLTRVSKYQKPVPGARAGTIEACLALATALVSIVAAILLFYDSDFRYQRIVQVNQGGVITYGETKPSSSVDANNQWAGAQFSVNHWLQLEVKQIGIPFLFPIVCFLYSLLALVLARLTYKYVLWREHRLDNTVIRHILLPLRWIVALIQTLYTRSFLHRLRKGSSYEFAFRDACDNLAFMHHHPPIQHRTRPWWKPLKRLELDPYTSNAVMDDSEYNPPEFPVQGMEALLTPQYNAARPSRNEVEKAAEILAADAFGLLNYSQALTLMYGEKLARVADRYKAHGELPALLELKQLARLYYVQEVLMPTDNLDGAHPGPIQFADMRQHAHNLAMQNEIQPNVNSNRVYAPVLGFRPLNPDDPQALNDGIAYASYQGNP